MAPAEAKAKPVAKAKPESIAAPPSDKPESISVEDMPITEEEYTLVIGLLSEVHQNSPEKIVDLTKAFRKQYDLDSKAALSKEIKTQGQVEFINVFLSS